MATHDAHRRPLRPLLLLALLAVPTAGMAVIKGGLGIDAENTSMKSAGTAQERERAQRIALIGEDHAILAVFESHDDARLSSLDLDDLAEEASEIEGVIAAFPHPASTGAMEALMVLLEGESDTAARSGDLPGIASLPTTCSRCSR